VVVQTETKQNETQMVDLNPPALFKGVFGGTLMHTFQHSHNLSISSNLHSLGKLLARRVFLVLPNFRNFLSNFQDHLIPPKYPHAVAYMRKNVRQFIRGGIKNSLSSAITTKASQVSESRNYISKDSAPCLILNTVAEPVKK
jgi:hypothetical protein